MQQLVDLIGHYQPAACVNVALPYQDLTIMEACLRTHTDYIDTANYEPENTDDPAWRKVYEKRCREKGFTAYFDYYHGSGLTAKSTRRPASRRCWEADSTLV